MANDDQKPKGNLTGKQQMIAGDRGQLDAGTFNAYLTLPRELDIERP
ncbi:MAG: hypothetical protein Q6373_005485 [Candidatus Sigynarchaeota archaeon]